MNSGRHPIFDFLASNALETSDTHWKVVMGHHNHHSVGYHMSKPGLASRLKRRRNPPMGALIKEV